MFGIKTRRTVIGKQNMRGVSYVIERLPYFKVSNQETFLCYKICCILVFGNQDDRTTAEPVLMPYYYVFSPKTRSDEKKRVFSLLFIAVFCRSVSGRKNKRGE